jgi:hypothetical protein
MPLAEKSRLRCGALNRAGDFCRVRAEPGKARCRFHGGFSTGPKTEAGRQRIAEAQRRRWRAFRGIFRRGSLIPAPGRPSVCKLRQQPSEPVGHLGNVGREPRAAARDTGEAQLVISSVVNAAPAKLVLKNVHITADRYHPGPRLHASSPIGSSTRREGHGYVRWPSAARPSQSFQKFLNRFGAKAVYRTVDAIDRWPR